MPIDNSLHDRVLKLEELLSHFQQTVDALNQVVIRLDQQFEQQRTDLGRITDELRQIRNKLDFSSEMPEQKPPHY